MPRGLLPVIVNRDSGAAAGLGDKLEPALREAFAKAGQSIDLHLTSGGEVARRVASIRSEAVAVGGGDGTIAAAAEVLAQQNRRLAVLPLGTLNHFARTLGLSGELDEAAYVAARGRSHRVDLGLAGSRVFINNASLGLYARMVARRERNRLPKWLATLPAALGVLWRPGARRLRLSIDGRVVEVKTPLLFVGNNRYSLDKGRIGERESLSDGLLSTFAVAQRGGLGLLFSAARILAGRADLSADFAATAEAREVVVMREGRHRLALDGEVIACDFPLRFSIWPRALEVMTPPD